MEPDAYREMAAVEDCHWWFRGRRAIARKLIATLGLPRDAKILEIGAGTGGNLRMLAEFGNLQAGESDEFARAMASSKAGMTVVEARLPGELPFAHGHFDLVCLFDVLEHVADDVQSLAAIRELLRRRGRVLITVPAHQWMWGPHDERLHHVRRYSRSALEQAAAAAGYRVAWLSYFNFLLFPVAVATRALDRLMRRGTSIGASVSNSWMNDTLFRIFALESTWLTRRRAPFGASLIAVLEAD